MKKLVVLSMLVLGLVFYSCSSDDDNNQEEKTSLVGNWQLTHVDFTVMEDGGIPASDGCIVELVAGYEFRADSSFYYILGEIDSPINFDGEYWTWEGDIDDFKMVQTNPANPPYNFGLNPTDINIEKVDGKTTVTFYSEMSNGSAATFTMVKVNEIDKTQLPVLTKPDGSSYHCGFFDH